MLYQTLSHTLKLAPHESPSRRTLNNYAIFYAKPSRKTLNNFGKPSTTLIIRMLISQHSFFCAVYCRYHIIHIYWSIKSITVGFQPVSIVPFAVTSSTQFKSFCFAASEKSLSIGVFYPLYQLNFLSMFPPKTYL